MNVNKKTVQKEKLGVRQLFPVEDNAEGQNKSASIIFMKDSA